MRILFAEDDRQLRTSVARGLREASYTVELAATGEQALAMATADHFDAILLDILLPGQDGVAVCSALRSQGKRVPILMLTALDAVEHRIRGLDAGADDYLTKPFDFGELLARVRALTRRIADPAERKIRVGDLVIDVGTRSAHRGKREIDLTEREFAFLLHLARRAGEVVSRQELLARVWDDAKHAQSNIIDVYAFRVRRKIDEGEAVPLFKTLRGAGYVLGSSSARRAARGAKTARKR
jgi:DNA-binding response OmpR family regulator